MAATAPTPPLAPVITATLPFTRALRFVNVLLVDRTLLDQPRSYVTPRRATLADVSELVRVINLAYKVEAHLFIDERTSTPDVRERLDRSNATFLVIDDDGDDVPRGTLAGAVYVEVDGDRGYFGMLAVDPSRQGRGLGRILVRAAESYCAAAGCTDLDIDVVDLRTELPPFYHALGFTRVGATPYGDPERTRQPVQLVHMTKPLIG